MLPSITKFKEFSELPYTIRFLVYMFEKQYNAEFMGGNEKYVAFKVYTKGGEKIITYEIKELQNILE